MAASDRRWCEALEEQRALDRLARDPLSARRQRLVAPVRVAAVVAMVAAAVGTVRVIDAYGAAAGVVLVWALPMLVLGVVLGVEKLLLHLTR